MHIHIRNAWICFVILCDIAVEQVFVLDRDVKGVLIHGQNLPISIGNRPSHRLYGIGSNTAGFGNALVIIALNDLELEESYNDTNKKQCKNN